jgi:triosephosphate isomerase
MKVIACVGEKLSERESGLTEDVVAKQLKAIIGQYFFNKNTCLVSIFK